MDASCNNSNEDGNKKMFEIDKVKFGEFIAQLRKEKGYTQKQIAAELFVSDKAVSKWERGISIPDVSLLMPLAKLLGVTVTELLECRRINENSGMNALQVEDLVKKTLSLSGAVTGPEKPREKRIKHICIYTLSLLAALLECALLLLLKVTPYQLVVSNLLVFELLSLIFGAYFFLAAREWLPAYYDENRLNFYNDGFFRISMPGIVFNNRSWPHILRTCRIWSVSCAILSPLICLAQLTVFPDSWLIALSFVNLLLFFAGLFVPIYKTGKRYQ